jgi:hypothetical protein
MIEDPNKANVTPMAAPVSPAARLPYAVELWNLRRTAPERVIGRAGTIGLARAIFTAAQTEHLGRRIVLRRGSSVLDRSG